MKEIIGKRKLKLKKLSQRIVVDEKETCYENKL